MFDICLTSFHTHIHVNNMSNTCQNVWAARTNLPRGAHGIRRRPTSICSRHLGLSTKSKRLRFTCVEKFQENSGAGRNPSVHNATCQDSPCTFL